MLVCGWNTGSQALHVLEGFSGFLPHYKDVHMRGELNRPLDRVCEYEHGWLFIFDVAL